MMCGWSTAATARASRTNRLRTTSSPASSLRATTRPSRSSRARYTAAIPPTPTSFSSRYPATREPAVSPASGPPGCAGESPATTPPPPCSHHAHPSLTAKLLVVTSGRPAVVGGRVGGGRDGGLGSGVDRRRHGRVGSGPDRGVHGRAGGGAHRRVAG